MPQPTKPQRPSDRDEDELEQLPPLEGDDEPFEGAPDQPLDEAPHDGADDAFDDKEAGDLIAPEGVVEPSDAGPVEAGDDRGIELDDHGLDDDSFRLGGDDADAPGVGDEDFGLGDGLDESEDDRGEEGLEDDDESLDDEPLPDLDGEDDDDELDWAAEAALLGRRAAPLPPWQDASWARQSPRSPDGPASDVACEGGRVLAAGSTLLAVAPGAAQPVALPGPSGLSRVAIEPASPHRALALTAQGALVLIDERGASPLSSPASPGGQVLRLAWARSPFVALASGQLFEHRGGGWIELLPRGTIALTSGPSGSLAALVRSADRLSLRHSIDGGASFRAREVAAPDGDAHGPAQLATTEAAQAIGLPGVLLLSRRAGPFLAVEGCSGALALAFAGQGADAPLLALLARDEASPLHLAHVDADGRATLLAELPPSPPAADDDESVGPPRAALAWDETRSVVWVASPSGLAAYGPARR